MASINARKYNPENEIYHIKHWMLIISIFVKSSANNYLTMIQLHPDTDNDHIFDAIDELDNAPNQWSDSR